MARRTLTTIFFYIFFLATFIMGSLLILVLMLFNVPKRKAAAAVSKSWAKALVKIAGIKVTVSGAENLDLNGPMVLISNHQGNFDIPIFMSVLPVNFRFLVKKELFSIPVFSWLLNSRGDIPIDRKNAARASQTIKELAQSLKYDDPVLIFPEGTRSPDGKVADFKRGSVMLASESGAKIVPIGISGSFKIQKKGSIMIYPCAVHVAIGAPVEGREDVSDIGAFPRELREKVISLIERY
jgi:1-acyl-sn-glycerol-3-phosphate acyltransferase